MVKAEREWRVRAAFQHPLLAKNVEESSGSRGDEETGRNVFEKYMCVLQD